MKKKTKPVRKSALAGIAHTAKVEACRATVAKYSTRILAAKVLGISTMTLRNLLKT